MRIKLIIFLLSLFCVGGHVFGQLHDWNITPEPTEWVIDNDVISPQASQSGWYSPYFQQADLDGDGLAEILVFDRNGGGLEVLTKSDDGYVVVNALVDNFPEVRDWLLLKDFDGDGVPDIFTSSYNQREQGIAVFQGVFLSDNRLAFQRIEPDVDYESDVISYMNGGVRRHIYVAETDIPSVVDVDGDGDLDVVAFEAGGSYVYWYENVSGRSFEVDMEFVLRDRCWGKFYEEGFNGDVILSENGECPSNTARQKAKILHAGSTQHVTDVNGDGQLDFLIGDVSFRSVTYLENDSSRTQDVFFDADPSFPSAGTPVGVALFPAISGIDIDEDGDEDLIFSPNRFPDDDKHSFWLYQNEGAGSYRFITDNWLDGKRLDFGSYSSVSVYYDSLSSNYEALIFYEQRDSLHCDFFRSSDGVSWTMYASQNIESTGNTDILYGGARASNVYRHSGSPRLVLGMDDGSLWLATVVSEGTLSLESLDAIDVGTDAAPHLYDIDRDGDLDLFVGERNGNINFFENQSGLTSVLDFGLEPDIEQVGRINTRSDGSFEGHSAPFFCESGDQLFLLTGSNRRGILAYGVNHSNLESEFEWIDEDIAQDGSLGVRQVPFLYSRAQGDYDLWIGNRKGGLKRWKLKDKISSIGNQRDESGHLAFYPNPSVNGRFEWNKDRRLSWMQVRDVLGRTVFEGRSTGSIVIQEKGIFYVTAQGIDGRMYRGTLIHAP